MRFPLAAIVLATLSACSAGSTEPSLAELRVGASTLRLQMTASATQLPPGARDTLRATLTNDGPAAVTLHFPSGCHILPYIRNSAGTIVLPESGGWICTMAFTELTLQAGESRTNEYVWDGYSTFTTEMPLRGRLPAGTYYVTAEALAVEAQLRTQPLAIELQ